MSDPETLRTYGARAAQYLELTGPGALNDPLFASFLNTLPAHAHVLDLGCGPGHYAAEMAAAGHRVTATDAVAEMVELAAAHAGVEAQQATFDDINGTDLYDGIWANFSLLHAPRDAMPGHLAALHQALKPGGLFHIGLKTGSGAKRDRLGRLYTYYTDAELTNLLETTGFTITHRAEGCDKGMDGSMANWIALQAHG